MVDNVVVLIDDEDDDDVVFIVFVVVDKCKKSIEFGNDAGERCLRGNVDELYELIDGTIEGERSLDVNDICGIIICFVGDVD